MRKYLLASLIGIGLFLIVGEIYARLTYKEPYLTAFMREDPVFHHLPAPNYRGNMTKEGDFDIDFATNNRGMRGPGDYDYEKPDGTFRIAVLGDSFTFGVGVEAEETASAVLQELLDKSTTGRYEVYNFGVNSYSPVLEYIYLKKEVIKYKPDLVILMLDICDIQDDYYYQPHLAYDAKEEITGCNPLMKNGRPDIKAFATHYSRLFHILDQKLFESFRKMKALGFVNYFTNKSKSTRNKTEILTNKKIDNIYFDRFLLAREGKDGNVVDRHWQRTAEYIAMIKRYLDGRNVRFILVTYPYGHQVGADQWTKGRQYWAFEPNRVYGPGKCFAIIENFARKYNIDIINLHDAMLAKKDEQLYFNEDGHWTKRGQEVAAEAIYDSDIFRSDTSGLYGRPLREGNR